MTEVVAALIRREEKFLICQRPAHKARGLLWEFVGGKVEPGESKEQALLRECREELDITVSVGKVYFEVIHEYPDLTVHLTLFSAEIAAGEPKLLEHADLRWILPGEIAEYDFCPADEEILEKIRQDHLKEEIQKELRSMSDPAYGDFHSKLMPTVPREKIIGIRIPVLRAFARKFAKTQDAARYLFILPHEYYEENNLHAFVIETIRDYDRALEETERFLSYMDNWATCDMMNPKVFRKDLQKLLTQIRRWVCSDHTYTVRYGIGMLMRYYLEEDTFSPEYLELAAGLRSEEYYVNLMIAWFFATALAKQYDAALPYLLEDRLDRWTHNKTIQKAIESYRITPEQKAYLRTLKRN